MWLSVVRRLLIPAASVAAVLVVGTGVVAAQSVKLVIAQGGDGTLYLVTDHGRFTIMPVPISDDELNASVDLGTIDGSQFSSPAAPTVTPTSAPAPTAAASTPLTLSGHGQQTTRPFHLSAGDYTSHWQLTGRCFHQGTLSPVDASVRLRTNSLGSGTVTAGGSGDTQLYGITDGDYYASVFDSGCDWKITLTPLQ